jgi:hypothetical protein
MSRDIYQKKLYDSEDLLKKEYNSYILSYPTLVEIQESFINKILNSRWWKRRYPGITVVFLYEKKRNSRDAWAGKNEIYLPREFRNQLYILHELAHVVCHNMLNGYCIKLAPHCLTYIEVYAALVKQFLGREVYDRFIQILIDHKIPMGV